MVRRAWKSTSDNTRKHITHVSGLIVNYLCAVRCEIKSWIRADHASFSDVTDGFPGTLHSFITSGTAYTFDKLFFSLYSMMNYIFVDNIIIVFPVIGVLYIHVYKYLHTKIVTWNYFSVSDGRIIYHRKTIN